MMEMVVGGKIFRAEYDEAHQHAHREYTPMFKTFFVNDYEVTGQEFARQLTEAEADTEKQGGEEGGEG